MFSFFCSDFVKLKIDMRAVLVQVDALPGFEHLENFGGGSCNFSASGLATGHQVARLH